MEWMTRGRPRKTWDDNIQENPRKINMDGMQVV